MITPPEKITIHKALFGLGVVRVNYPITFSARTVVNIVVKEDFDEKAVTRFIEKIFDKTYYDIRITTEG